MRFITIGRRTRLRSVRVLSLTYFWARSTNMPRTIESLQQIMHGLYPASKYTQGLTPQLLVRCVPFPSAVQASSPFIGFWVLCTHVCMIVRLARAYSIARLLVKLYLFTVNVSPHVYFQECQRREPKCESFRLQAVGKNENGLCSRYTSRSMMRITRGPNSLFSSSRCFESHVSNTR